MGILHEVIITVPDPCDPPEESLYGATFANVE